MALTSPTFSVPDFVFFFNDTATTEIYTLSLHDALPISPGSRRLGGTAAAMPRGCRRRQRAAQALNHPGGALVCRFQVRRTPRTPFGCRRFRRAQRVSRALRSMSHVEQAGMGTGAMVNSNNPDESPAIPWEEDAASRRHRSKRTARREPVPAVLRRRIRGQVPLPSHTTLTLPSASSG